LIWAYGGYNAWQSEAAVAKLSVLRMEIVKRSDDVEGFVVLPRRWGASIPSPGPDETGVSPRTSRTSPKPWPPSVSLTSIQLALRPLARAEVAKLNKLPVCNARWWRSAKGRIVLKNVAIAQGGRCTGFELPERVIVAPSSDGWDRLWSGDELGQLAQVLGDGGEVGLVGGAKWAAQPQPVEPQNAFEVCELHLDFFSLIARDLLGISFGDFASEIARGSPARLVGWLSALEWIVDQIRDGENRFAELGGPFEVVIVDPHFHDSS
jgi:hypothetical protein